MADFTIKQFDTLPQLLAILQVGGKTIPDLANALSVNLRMANRSEPDVFFFNKPGVVVDAPSGKVAYNWSVGDTDVSGEYVAEWHIVYSAGGTRTIPTVGKFSISIEKCLPETP